MSSTKFNWDDLRFFIEIARTENLSAAAKRLGMNHSTVARRVQALEKGLAARLFDKTPSGYTLTTTGSELFRIAEDVEASCISAQELIAGQNPVPSGIVRLSVPEGFGSQFLMPRIGEFYDQYPGIDLEIMALPQFLSISKREADIAITHFRPDAGRLVARELTKYTLFLYGTPEYLKRSAPIQRLDDLRKQHLISNIDDLIYSTQLRFLDEILPDAHFRLRVKSINAQLAAVKAGLGLGMLPRFMAASQKDLKAVLPDDINVTWTFWLSMHEDMRHVSRIAAVWDWVKKLVAAHQPLLTGALRSVPPGIKSGKR